MTRDLIILTSIIVYWFLLSLTLTYVLQDPLLTGAFPSGNVTDYNINIDTAGAFNTSGTSITEASGTSPKSFLDMIVRMFTFRIPDVPDFPNGIFLLIEFLNWGLVLLVGLIVYRMIRHGGG